MHAPENFNQEIELSKVFQHFLSNCQLGQVCTVLDNCHTAL